MTSRRFAFAKVALAVAALVLAAPHLTAYVLNGGKWKVQLVPYYINTSTPDLSPEQVIAAVQAAADVWANESGASIKFQYAGTTTSTVNGLDYVNNVLFRNSTNSSAIASTYYWYSSSTGEMVDFDMIFWDAGFQFFTGTGTCSNGFYVEDVGAHEFGHALGLGHSAVSTATMVSSQSTCTDTKRSLDPDDIAGVEYLYPPAAAIPEPSDPTNLVPGTPTASSVALAWADNSTNEDTFLVERSPDGVNNWFQVASTGANVRSYTDAGLAASTSYHYRVRASNAGGFSGYTNIAATTTTALPAPAKPTTPTPANGATNQATKLTLKWAASSNATSYEVWFGANGALALKGTVTTPSLAVSSLLAGTNYSWKVVAKNSVGSTSGDVWTFTTKAAVVRKK